MKKLVQKLMITSLLICCMGVGHSQKSQVARADKEFTKYAYIDAREIYLKVVEDGYESAQIFERLGDTYYFNSQYAEASDWYTSLFEKFPDQSEPIYYYRAAQSLKSVDKYAESDALMKAYEEKGGADLLVRNFNEDPNYLETIATFARGYDIEKVSINSGESDFGPSYYGDRLVFASNRSAGAKSDQWTELPYLDLYVSNIGTDGQLSEPIPLDNEINTLYHESSAVFTKDGNTMYFTRNNFVDGKVRKDVEDEAKTIRLKLLKATRNGDGSWGTVEELPFNSDKHSVAHPALSNDGKRLYFSSDMEGTLGMSDLWYADINEDGTYGEPQNMGPGVNTESRDSFPFISDDNKLYFSSDGRAGLGGYDIYVTEFDASGNAMADKITNLGAPTNSNADDFGFIFNEEDGMGFMSSNRDGNGGSASDDIYKVIGVCIISINGEVTNDVTGEVIPGASVTLLDENNNVVGTTTADSYGRYSFDEVAACAATYIVRSKADNCEFNETLAETPDKTGVINVDVALPCDPCAANDLGCKLDLQPIYFDFDRYNIREDAAIELAKILAAMREYPQLIIHIESHTDSRGNDAYNEALSEKRAQSTLNWLVEQGIDRSRLSAKGYGEYQLVNECSNGVDCTEEAHQLNRRSMFLIQN